MRETEIRTHVTESESKRIERVLRKITEPMIAIQEDVYFDSRSHKWLAVDPVINWLRLRYEGERGATLTLKHFEYDDMGNTIDATEIELPASDREDLWGQSTCLKRLTWSDCASSLYNRTSATCFRLYDAADRTGGYHRISPGDTIANLGTWSYNDVITSNSAIAGSTC